jgi:hypothetical protein
MARLLSLLAPRISGGGPVYDRINGWDGDLTARGHAVALRVASGLHRLVLGGDAELAALYPPHSVGDAALLGGVEAAFDAHRDFFAQWLDRPPQTNEVRRSAVLIAAAHWLAARHPLPLRLSELGASAGLNLGFDRFALQADGHWFGPADSALVLAPEVTGPLPYPAHVTVAERRGVDLAPVDPSDPDDRLRLLSYLWPDQTHRLTMTRTAIDMARDLGIAVDPGDAADWLHLRLADPVPGTLHLIFHTVAWQYFPPITAQRCLDAIEAAGARATPEAPLAHLGLEADASGAPGAAITLRIWPGVETLHLGRADFHGRWVDWRARAI